MVTVFDSFFVRYSDYARLERENDNLLTLIAAERQKTDAAEARLAEAMEAIDRLLAPFEGEECWRDHHGYCQTHFLEEDCSVNAARRVREGG